MFSFAGQSRWVVIAWRGLLSTTSSVLEDAVSMLECGTVLDRAMGSQVSELTLLIQG
jgi:hypothetical protein